MVTLVWQEGGGSMEEEEGLLSGKGATEGSSWCHVCIKELQFLSPSTGKELA